MNTTRLRWTLCAVLTAVMMQAWCSGYAAGDKRPAGHAATTPATSPSGTGVLALVNGQPIYMEELHEILLSSYGMPVAQQLVANELVRQEAQAKKLAVTDADVRAEEERTLVQTFPDLTPDQRQKALDQLLLSKSITRKLWDLTMRRNALLAKLAQLRVKVTPEDIVKAYHLRYGRKVTVRHIQLATLAEAEAVRKEILGGADFVKVAHKKSISPSRDNGGLLDPISKDSAEYPRAINESALAMTKVGQISQVVQVGTTFHILKLEKSEEPQAVSLDRVKKQIEADVRADMAQRLQQQILLELFTKAQESGQIHYVDPILKRLDDQAKAAVRVPPPGQSGP